MNTQSNAPIDNSARGGIAELNSLRIEKDGFGAREQDSTITITFSGRGHCRMANMILIPCGQGAPEPPITIMFGGAYAGYADITGVNVSANNSGVTVNGYSITIPSNGGGWGGHTLIKLYPDDEITYTAVQN